MTWALVVGVLALFIAAVHSYLGERYIIRRLFRTPQLPPIGGSDAFTRRVIRFAWHLTSIAWVGLGLVPVALARGYPVGMVVAGTFGVSAVVTLAVSRGRHLAWIVFAAIAVAAWLGR